MASLIRKYDIKAAPNGEKRPESFTLASRGAPNPNISIMIKEREVNSWDTVAGFVK